MSLHIPRHSKTYSFASGSLVPCKRTISGIVNCNSLVALMIPSAITSHRMIPPTAMVSLAGTLVETSLTDIDEYALDVLGRQEELKGFLYCVGRRATSDVKLYVSSAFMSGTERTKLAGEPPWRLRTSMVAMASPAPLTRHPISPSSLMKFRPYYG